MHYSLDQIRGRKLKKIQAMATERYRKNNISSFKLDDGTLVDSHPAKEALLFQTYKARLGTVSPTDMKFDLPSIIPRATNLDGLTTPFTHEEIDNVIKGMPPSPDGFSGAFLKACWPIIRHDFYALCEKFYEGTLNVTSINDGLITLIPKINAP